MKLRQTRFLYNYWSRVKGDRPAPDRSEIEPSDISSILGDTFILERAEAGNFPFRLAGSRLCSIFRRELKSRDYLGLWIGRDREAVGSILNAITEEMAATVIGSQGFSERGDSVVLETVLLPMRRGNDTCDRLLGAMVPSSVPCWIGVHPVMKQRITGLRLIWPDEMKTRFGEAASLNFDTDQEPDQPPVIVSGLSGQRKARRPRHLLVVDDDRDAD